VTIKAILDTNVIVSGIFWFEILEAWQKRRFLAVSLSILNEYRRVLVKMSKKRPSSVLGSILEVIELHSEMVEPGGRICPADCSSFSSMLMGPSAAALRKSSL
jgi:predicted nucleic acid-binding protein